MILAILQARMSSTRLPGKVMKPLAGAPMIQRQIERIAASNRIADLVVATSDQSSDDVLAQFLEGQGVSVYRGPLDHVLNRFVGAAEAFGPATRIVRLTADCPFADPEVIDATIEVALQAKADYASNTPPERTFPKGLDVEIFTLEALQRAAVDPSPQAIEHVTWDMARQPQHYREAFHNQPVFEDEVRWTVDRQDDYEFVAAVYDALYKPEGPLFTSNDIRAFVRANPQWAVYGGDPRV
jgi:spore coat polysaccharide biosynthesis protein SpsF